MLARVWWCVAMCVSLCGVAVAAQALQAMPANDLHRVRAILREGHDLVKKEYYDPSFHGVDLDARFAEYDEKLKAAPTMNAGLTLVAAFLDGLRDSHTFFQPPAHAYTLDYGYRLAVVGDDILVERVKPGTDARAKVRPGDRVISINGSGVGRESFMRMQYLLNVLQPQPTTRLVLRDPAGLERTVVVETTVTPGRSLRDLSGSGASQELQDMELQQQASDHLIRHRHVERGGVMIWKMPIFASSNGEIDGLFAIARKQSALILDLRGNPGGYVDTLTRMIGNLFPAEVPIGTRVTRKGRAPLVAKGRGGEAFTGKLIVLVDGASGSSAEILARVVQLEQRGTVIGDRSAGAVMEARGFPFAQGDATLIIYGFSVTSADLIMKDGRGLELAGVVPDERVLPTGLDLSQGRDPVLARAAKRVGLDLDPVAAGTLFPFEWK
jgi:carboxyl-terminal processing protease